MLRFFFIILILFYNDQLLAKVDPELRKHLKEAINSSESFNDRFEAEVWLVDMSARLSRYIKDKSFRIQFLQALHLEASNNKLPPEMVLALIQTESAFQPYAISRVGAQGYMQIMPFWRKEIGRENDNLMNFRTNLKYGCAILAHYLKREKGNWVRALARYNGSLGKTWYPERVMKAWKKRWFVQSI